MDSTYCCMYILGIIEKLESFGPISCFWGIRLVNFLWSCATGSAGSAQLPGVTSCLVEDLEESFRRSSHVTSEAYS